jgi:aspartyl-tRNA(Asn)/glutamyl-tRNA(Gln) amidotransferase subunit A
MPIMNIIEFLLLKKKQKANIKKIFLDYVKSMDKTFNFVNNFFNIKTNIKLDNKTIIGSIKSNFMINNEIVDAGSNILFNLNTCYDSTAFRLLKKNFPFFYNTVQDEFAMGSLGIFSNKIAKNPWFDNIPSGGSSSGSACSVALGCSDFSLGSDTGGSVRLPAAFCGVLGFKPSYGAISRFGLIHFSSMLDTVGIISRDINILQNVFNQLFCSDNFDSTCYVFHNKFKENVKKGNILLKKNNNSINTLVFKNDLLMKNNIYINFIENIKKNNFKINFSSFFDFFNNANKLYEAITFSEAVSTLNRYSNNCIYLNNNNDFGKEVKRRLLLGKTFLSNGEYKTAIYKSIDLVKKFKEIFKNIDLFVYPTYLSVINNDFDFHKDRKKMDQFNVLANILQYCSISIPFFVCENKTLIGIFSIQLMCKKYNDFFLLDIVKFLFDKNICPTNNLFKEKLNYLK